MDYIKEIAQLCKDCRTRDLTKGNNNQYLVEFIIKKTSFLNNDYDDIHISQRVWHVLNDQFNLRYCTVCNVQKLNWCNYSYAATCSISCGQQNKVTRNKIKKTNLKKYGVESHNQCSIIKKKKKNTFKNKTQNEKQEIVERRRRTNLKKYGHINVAQSEKVKEIIKKTNLKKYGVEYALQSPEIQNKVQLTNKKIYNVQYPMQNVDIRNKAKKTFMNNYGVDNPFKNPKIQDDIKNTIIEKYGVENISNRHLTTDTIDKLNNKQWLINQNENMSMTAIARELGVSDTAIFHKFKKFTITPKNYTLDSIFSCDFEEFLKSLNVQYIKNTRSIIKPFEIDFYLPDYKIGFELNGAYWHSELQGKDRYYHVNKTNMCLELDITLINIFDYQWYNIGEIFKDKINNMLHNSKTYYARNCILTPISTFEEQEFLNQNHIQGYISSSIVYGLYHNDQLCSVMSFIQSRYNKKYEWELLRFASIGSNTIAGGASKLFKHFIMENNPKSVVSYSNRMFNKGTLYNKIGFKFIRNNDPNYVYTKRYDVVYSRIKFQKHKLSKLLDIFDPELTEWKNMKNNGYDRIWDCGNSVWEWNNE